MCEVASVAMRAEAFHCEKMAKLSLKTGWQVALLDGSLDSQLFNSVREMAAVLQLMRKARTLAQHIF